MRLLGAGVLGRIQLSSGLGDLEERFVVCGFDCFFFGDFATGAAAAAATALMMPNRTDRTTSDSVVLGQAPILK